MSIIRADFQSRVPIGSVVWYLENTRGRKEIRFGTVDSYYTYEVCVQLYDFCERRMIDGVPVEKIETPTRWRKLPKGWTYSTELFKLTERPFSNVKFNLSNPEDIIKAIEQGILVPAQERDYCHFEDVIDKANGWRIERKYNPYEGHCSYISLRYDKVYTTYNEAKAALDEELAEFQRQSELSDYDWSLEQIDKELTRWATIYGVSSEEKQRYREWLLGLDNLEEVEVRVFDGQIQWKYVKSKKWMSIEV